MSVKISLPLRIMLARCKSVCTLVRFEKFRTGGGKHIIINNLAIKLQRLGIRGRTFFMYETAVLFRRIAVPICI